MFSVPPASRWAVPFSALLLALCGRLALADSDVAVRVRTVLATDSGHYIQLDQPDLVVLRPATAASTSRGRVRVDAVA